MKKSKILAMMITGAIVFSSLFSLNAFAGNDNVGFSFTIKAWQGNTRVEDGRYRETANPNNSWKVNLTDSGEGTETITRFWLENFNQDNVSSAIDAVEGSGAHYKEAYGSASQVTCYLTAENNNWNNETYIAYGFWDEETTIIVAP